MIDSRMAQLADIIVNYSISVNKGDIIKVNFGVDAKDLALEIYRKLIEKGALPRAEAILPGFSYAFFRHSSDEQLKTFPRIAMYEARIVAGSISIGAEYNTKEFSNVDPKKVALRSKVVNPISKVILEKDNWVGCEYPTHSLAQDAEMSMEELEDFFFRAVLQDWKKESLKQDALKRILDKGRKVRILGDDTDLRFGITGRTANKADGKRNMPDGEVFIAPQEKSTEGYISYTYPTIKNGVEVDVISLQFKAGKVVKASAKKNSKFLNTMVKMDRGAQYLGEFGIGTNYRIDRFIKQILFDEKIGGTVHLALGMAYREGGGRNESALHWDMIKDLRRGGELWVDGHLIQKNGKFTFRH
ncbi:MAG: aminopeptidase [Nanoarchaeota archaeon]